MNSNNSQGYYLLENSVVESWRPNGGFLRNERSLNIVGGRLSFVNEDGVSEGDTPASLYLFNGDQYFQPNGLDSYLVP